MSGEEIQLNLEPPSTPIKGPARRATLNGTQSPLGSASSAGVISSPPSPEEGLFSPTLSTATDITDDYGWQTPVKGQALSTTLDTDSLESSQTEEENDSGGDDDRAGQIGRSPTKPLERSKRAKSLRPRLSISSLRSEDATRAVLSKRKESSTSPVDTRAWVADQGKFLEGIAWPSIQTGQKTPKRSRHIRTEYWTSEQASNISTDFSAEGTWLLRPRAASEVGGARKFHLDPVVSCTQDQSAEPSSSNSIVPTITVSPPEDDQIDSALIKDDADDPRSKSMSSGDGTVKAVLTLLSTQKTSTSAKDKTTIRKSLHTIIPLEIRERLREDDQRCPVQTAKGLRCKNRHRANASIIMQSLDSLTAIKSSEVLHCMKDVITVLCSSVHQRVARKELETWETDIDKLCDIQEDQGHVASHRNYRLVALADWINTLGGGESFLETVETTSPPTSQETIPSNIPQVSSLIQKFIPYVTKASVRLSVSEALEKLLVKPLMKSEIERVGSLYVYWQPGNFGHLKIGYSKNEISKRVKEWSSKCRKPMEVYFPKRGSDEEHLQVSHICRVEKLVHTELKNCRRIEEMCPVCNGNHIEWFEVSRQLAIAVVRKWMAWMRTSPYEERSCGGKTEWVLKDEQRRKIKELSQPLQEIAISRQDMEKRGRKAPLHAQYLSVSRAGRARSPRTRSKSM
ncbi:hypothetical protein CDV55_106928 [Aspergillus turcosus]|nr:hypothetical protein CDV55_106928 [Aspergillus turcosus]